MLYIGNLQLFAATEALKHIGKADEYDGHIFSGGLDENFLHGRVDGFSKHHMDVIILGFEESTPYFAADLLFSEILK